jgi:hypothetical protein
MPYQREKHLVERGLPQRDVVDLGIDAVEQTDGFGDRRPASRHRHGHPPGARIGTKPVDAEGCQHLGRRVPCRLLCQRHDVPGPRREAAEHAGDGQLARWRIVGVPGRSDLAHGTVKSGLAHRRHRDLRFLHGGGQLVRQVHVDFRHRRI